MKLRSKNDEFLKRLYREAYHLGAVFYLTRFKTEELEQKIAEVRRKFKVCIFLFLEVVKKIEVTRKKIEVTRIYWL